jgi:GNAT superfamily N-acetyltransferase
MLFSGRTLYVDDLVTNENTRSRGYGGQLLTWVAKQAKAEGCGRLTLDSGVEKMHAHRFYHRMGMAITAHHFTWLRPL